MMTALPYRATVFLYGSESESIALLEREFERSGDAVDWCRVMSLAQSRASGRWFVAARKPGRIYTLIATSQSAVAALTPRLDEFFSAPVADRIAEVLTAQGMDLDAPDSVHRDLPVQGLSLGDAASANFPVQ